MAQTPQPMLTPALLGSIFDTLRRRQPKIHCITSPVAGERTANTLLALGCHPSLTNNSTEVGIFVQAADALLINLGMYDPAETQRLLDATVAARLAQRPWVLDAVFVNISPQRQALALALAAQGPDVLKANASEAFVLDSALPATTRVATGPTDMITLGGRRATIANGHGLAGQVTAMGCALGAVIAACLSVETDPVAASATALCAYGIAAEQAAATAAGPGSFAYMFYDTLAALTGADIAREARIT